MSWLLINGKFMAGTQKIQQEERVNVGEGKEAHGFPLSRGMEENNSPNVCVLGGRFPGRRKFRGQQGN